VINLYPFYYNATTANVRYHQTYTLTLETITTTLSTVAVTLDKVAYAQGESVAADLTVQQPGAPQDLVVEARVRQTTTDAEVATLLYQSLNALTGEATFAATWDSTGYAPGSYYVEVALCDFAGQVLQKAVQDFQLGIIAGEVVTLTATPATFTIGDVITLALSFRNAGTVPLTGTAFLVLQTADGLTTTLTYTEPLANLLPAQTAQIEATWNTAGAARTDYRLLGYVQHDGRVTGPTMVDLTVKSNSIYLPLVLRRVP